MRKGLVAVLAALAATAVAAPAPAAEFSYGGVMRFNYQGGNPGTVNDVFLFDEDDSQVHIFEYRIRQFFNLKVNEHVTTNVKFEWNSEFGDERQLAGGSGDLQFGSGANEVQFRIKNAFLRFDVPNAPVSLTVGQQDFSTPKALIAVEDGTGIKLAFTGLGGEHTAWWSRLARGAQNQTGADDADWFGIAPSFTAGDVTISPHLSYATIGPGAVDAELGLAGVADGSSDVLYLGLNTSGKLGALGFTADLVFQNGELSTVIGDFDIFSYIFDASVTLDVGPGALTVKALYSPGDADLDTDFDSWFDFINTDIGWSPFFHDGSDNGSFTGNVLPGATIVGNDGEFRDGGILALGAEFAFSPYRVLTLTPSVYWLQAEEDVITAAGGSEDFYGVEAGVQAVWMLWDSVQVLAQFDYLFAGDVFENASGNTEDAWRFIFGPRIFW